MDDEILKQLLDSLKSDPEKAVEDIRKKTKAPDGIKKYIEEYRDLNRNQREGQIEKIQADKTLADNKIARMVKIYINHAQNIVETLSAFIVGKPVTLIPSEENKLSELFKQIWRVNRLDSKILKATMIKLSQTQVAMNFYITDVEETSILNKILVKMSLKAQAKEIKVKVLDNTQGIMTPFFTTSGNMLLFMWEYETEIEGKKIKKVQIWDDKSVHYIDDSGGKFAYEASPTPHGFDRIPIAYDDQFEPQWYPVRSAADRHEVALSKLGDANDYSGHPTLITEGKVIGMPLKEESGKHFNIPIKVTKSGEILKGSVSYLESTMAPESNKLEIEKLEDVIAYGSGVPNLSLEKLKSLGNVAEKTVKLMFLGTDLKAEIKRTETRTFIERCINIIISGIVNATNTSLLGDSKSLYYDIQFNSILPSDISEKVKFISEAVSGKIMSRQTGIEILDLVDDVDFELDLIEKENPMGEGDEKETKINPLDTK